MPHDDKLKIEWRLDRLTVKDYIDIVHWYNSTDIPSSLAKLMIIARSCTDDPLPMGQTMSILQSFIEEVTEYQLKIAKAEYERIKDKPP
jgi:hypothetical protein